jgi:hypothetical protein
MAVANIQVSQELCFEDFHASVGLACGSLLNFTIDEVSNEYAIL